MFRNIMPMLHIIDELLPKFGMGIAAHPEGQRYHIDSYMYFQQFYSEMACGIIILEGYLEYILFW